MRRSEESFIVVADERDWLLELGKAEGHSRVLTTDSATAKALLEQFWPSKRDALYLPWEEAAQYVRFEAGKVSIWSGPTFSGKTQLLRQLMLCALQENRRVLFVSLEEEPADVLREFVCMAALTRQPSAQFVQDCFDLWHERLYVFDGTEAVDPKIILGIICWAAREKGIGHVVIDSLMRLNLRTDDYDGQRELGNLLGRVARKSGVHIHLVAHPRKTAKSSDAMDLYDIRGAGDIIAQADLVVTLERKKEEMFDNALTVWKQRGDYNWIGALRLYYDAPSRQLKFERHHEPRRFLPPESYVDTATGEYWARGAA